ncbi:permease [Plastoroseomonas arctica]|uniref:Permease n=1 Tax=Plastoroseomonas arctica TaxID=1509237 RepID=A0AAF1JXG4_9PROT|nr:permease [Plastoroseomonas arctica]MBR0656182.1 hypothetical protein [Plastoroseomonas arctica]
MSATQGLLWLLALIALGLCLKRSVSMAIRAGRDGAHSLVRVLPLFTVALPMAAFLAELVPADIAEGYLGPESGLRGILIASVAGGFIPGGPFVSFPLVLTFTKAGAGVPQMAALVTGWAIYGFHRVIAWEVPVLGWRFVAIRMLAGLALPVLTGLGVSWLLPWFPGALVRP